MVPAEIVSSKPTSQAIHIQRFLTSVIISCTGECTARPDRVVHATRRGRKLHLGLKHASDLEPRIPSGEPEKNIRPEQDQEFSAEGSTFLSDPNNLSCQVSGR